MQYVNEPVTVEVTNLGIDTLSQLELSYLMNDDAAVTETFTRQMKPGETANFTFTQLTNLAEPGNYFINIYPTYGDEYTKNDTVSGVFISYIYLIQIGPNPFDNSLSFISQGHYHDITIGLYNMGGVLVYEDRFDEFLPKERISISIPPLSRGVYIMKVRTPFGTNRYKLIKR
jgi:hypothetical protein